MTQFANPRTGGDIWVDQLRIQGVRTITCVPGESYLGALDAMVDRDIEVIICRHEGGAAIMAEAQGKLTQRPGICFVTRGPGATNAAHGVHIARHDETPMILFVGQVERSFRGRDAFQELDYEKVFDGIAKWVVEITEPKRIPEIIARAYNIALNGVAGPVVISLPEDILTEMAVCADASYVERCVVGLNENQISAITQKIEAAKSPCLIIGGGLWGMEGIKSLGLWSEALNIPVITEFRRTDRILPDHPCFAGDLGFGPNPKIIDLIKGSDLVLSLGAKLSEVPSQSFSLLSIPNPQMEFIQVLGDSESLGRVYQPNLGLIANPDQVVTQLWAQQQKRPIAAKSHDHVQSAHEAYRLWSNNPPSIPGQFQYGEVIKSLRDRLPPETIITNGAGNYAIWVHRYWHYQAPYTQLAPTSGSVGYSVPSGVMAAHLRRDCQVISFAGDGCFLMNGNEMATAIQYDIPLIVIIIDNGMYGTIRMHQEKHYPHRVIGTDLKNPDFAVMMKAFGGHGERVESTEDFMPAFERARASGKASVIHCLIDPEAITPAKTLSAVTKGH